MTTSADTNGILNFQNCLGCNGLPTQGGNYAIEGDQGYLMRTDDNVNISFENPAGAFGFFVTDFGDLDPTVLITSSNGGNIKRYTFDNLIGSSANVYFGGITDTDTFDNIAFDSAGGFVDCFTLDRLVVAPPQPIPGLEDEIKICIPRVL